MLRAGLWKCHSKSLKYCKEECYQSGQSPGRQSFNPYLKDLEVNSKKKQTNMAFALQNNPTGMCACMLALQNDTVGLSAGYRDGGWVSAKKRPH